MTTPGKVVGLAHEPVGAPADSVRGARFDGQAAAGAEVGLDRRCGGEGLHVPTAVALVFDAQAAYENATEVERVVVIARAATRTVGSWH